MCTYRPRYLEKVLNWLRSNKAEEKYRFFLWDNGGAAPILKRTDLKWHCVKDEDSQKVVNVGKALGMQYLIDVVRESVPEASCYLCMDDDIIVDPLHMDALVSIAKRPGFGMIAGRFHPFNSIVPDGGSVELIDPCPLCALDCSSPKISACPHCGGNRKDPNGLRLRTYPPEDRTVRNIGKVAGGLFSISTAAIATLPWSPYLYPILTVKGTDRPVVYWTEDASLDAALTNAGLVNGYLDGLQHMPAIHLPEMDEQYTDWKRRARDTPPTKGFESE